MFLSTSKSVIIGSGNRMTCHQTGDKPSPKKQNRHASIGSVNDLAPNRLIYVLDCLNHFHIWRVSPQLSGNTSHIWTRYSIGNHFDNLLNMLLNKQSSCQCFQMPLWRDCYVPSASNARDHDVRQSSIRQVGYDSIPGHALQHRRERGQ